VTLLFLLLDNILPVVVVESVDVTEVVSVPVVVVMVDSVDVTDVVSVPVVVTAVLSAVAC
jgi:hypothetical protein